MAVSEPVLRKTWRGSSIRVKEIGERFDGFSDRGPKARSVGGEMRLMEEADEDDCGDTTSDFGVDGKKRGRTSTGDAFLLYLWLEGWAA